VIARSGVLPVLQDRLDHTIGRRRSLAVEGLLVAMQVNGLRRHHQATLAEVARVLNSFTDQQRADVGIRNWKATQAYDRADQLFNRLNGELEAAWDTIVDGVATHVDVAWFADRLLDASLENVPVRSKSVAVDGTDIDTWAKLHGQLDDTDFDGDPDAEPDEGSSRRQRRVKGSRRARILGVGADGRNIYTLDLDARAGHRSATGSREAGLGVGYELHTAVLARDAKWSNGIDRLNLGPDVPPVITTISLVPAGSRRDDAIVPKLIAAKNAGLDIDDVIWDRGYSQLRPERTNYPLSRSGIQTTFRPKDAQRVARPFSEDALLIEGHLISSHVPMELRRLLRMPPMSSTAAKSARYEEPFNHLARYRFERNGRPDADGATRWRCPFCAGRLRSRSVPKSMRGSRSAPLVALPDGTSCCGGSVTASAAELPHWQRFLPGTTAWRTSYGRRQVVEGVNAMLKGGFVNIQHKFLRVFGLAKMTVLLAFTLSGYNLEAIRSFVARKATERTAAPPKRSRKRRRTGTWADVIGDERPASGRAPPLG
jgi:hypothetical protein